MEYLDQCQDGGLLEEVAEEVALQAGLELFLVLLELLQILMVVEAKVKDIHSLLDLLVFKES
jgi:hypothetical protein